MDIVDQYDYYYLHNPRRSFVEKCEYTLCEKSSIYVKLKIGIEYGHEFEDVLELLAHNIPGEPMYYSCCLNYDNSHACNVASLMVGSKLERKLLTKVAIQLGIEFDDIYKEIYHSVYQGSYLVNGTFYYSVFRETNNNRICHNTNSREFGEETVCYFYDKTLNRGIKLFTRNDGVLRINDRDGNEIENVNESVMNHLYDECLDDKRHYTTDVRLIARFFDSIKRKGLRSIDTFKNKIFINYTIGLNMSMDKIHPDILATMSGWNGSLVSGRITMGISQRLSYSKTKSEMKKQNEQKIKLSSCGFQTDYMVESQRRKNVRRSKALNVNSGNRTALGTNEVKTHGLAERLDIEKDTPSAFNKITVSYLPYIKTLSCTVQKLQVEHVHAESSKTIPHDAFNFICMNYIGNISTAGKNMLFVDRVCIAYGHVNQIVSKIETGLERCAFISICDSDGGGGTSNVHPFYYIVLNNLITKYRCAKDHLVRFIYYVKRHCFRFAWVKCIGDFLCLYYFEGVAMFKVADHELCKLDVFNDDGIIPGEMGPGEIYFSRDEFELLTSLWLRSNQPESLAFELCSEPDLVRHTNEYMVKRFGTQQSVLAKHLDQYTDLTPPAKRSVSANSRKSSCVNVYYSKPALLIRGFHIFVDPNEYERKVCMKSGSHQRSRYNNSSHPCLCMKLKNFRDDPANCPPPQNTDMSVTNFYMLRTMFGDICGNNVEDANVINENVDLCLTFTYSFSVSFVDNTTDGVEITIPEKGRNVTVCSYDRDMKPIAVLIYVCAIKYNRYNEKNPPIQFPLFNKFHVSHDLDGNYHLYMIRRDAVLLRSIDMKRPLTCHTKVMRHFDPNVRNVITIDFRAIGTVDKYDGIKVINSFGQKGLARIKKLDNIVANVDLVMNNCSFASRLPIGQYNQMKNCDPIVHNNVLSGYSAIFFSESEPTTKTCPMRLDEMMRSVIISANLPLFQNIKSSMDNMYNPGGLLYPDQTRQVLDLYRCYGNSYQFDGDSNQPFSTKNDISKLFKLFNACDAELRKLRATNKKIKRLQ